MAKQYDVLFRLLMLGDSGVGKTCMLRRFTESEFDASHISTIGKPSSKFSKVITRVCVPRRLIRINRGEYLAQEECRGCNFY